MRWPTAVPVFALLVNAFVWGASWWPFRYLQTLGLHPLWATALVYVAAAFAVSVWRPASLRQLVSRRSLWLIALASGLTNATFNWAVGIGDVVRVVLLFYLMPLWALLLARVLLKEPLTPFGFLRVALALGGAALVLSHGGVPDTEAAEASPGVAGNSSALWPLVLPDALALVGGFAFALNNVMLRREAAQPEEGRALAMFVGGALVAGVTVVPLSLAAAISWPSAPAAWALPAGGLALAFIAANLCLQLGAARLSASTTAMVMPSEVLFAALTWSWWGGATLHWSVLAGGAAILGATFASVLDRSSPGH